MLMQRLPPERHDEIVPLRTLIEAGVHVSLGTDNVPVTLFAPIWHSIARRSRYVGEPVAAGQGLSREQAIRAATIDGAYLTFDEHRKGSLEPGKLADVAVLDADPLTVAENKIRDIRAVMTMVGGRVVYAGEEWTAAESG